MRYFIFDLDNKLIAKIDITFGGAGFLPTDENYFIWNTKDICVNIRYNKNDFPLRNESWNIKWILFVFIIINNAIRKP